MKIVESLETYLEREEEAILCGNYDVLRDLLPEKLHLSDALARAGGSVAGDRLRSLRDKSLRNEALLRAASKGFKAARSQISDVLDTGRTYGRDGGRTALTTRPSLEKKL